METGTIGFSDLDLCAALTVSMKSGLGDRNNSPSDRKMDGSGLGLNEVRSWRPEQYRIDPGTPPNQIVSMKSGLGDRNNLLVAGSVPASKLNVSMKSGLRDRNNPWSKTATVTMIDGLNEVRS